MGGKNHQPCREYLPISTRMSRCASLAFAHLELANVALEDLILSEMKGKIGNLSAVKSRLTLSQESVTKLIDTITELEVELNHRDFQDLLTVCSVNLDAIGQAFIANNMVSATAWSQVSKNAREGGFRKNLAFIHESAQALVGYTAELGKKVTGLQKNAEDGVVMQVLEENLHGNLKPEFAKLYCAWSRFQEVFLASALLSTEVYYAFNGYGSLMDISAQSSVA